MVRKYKKISASILVIGNEILSGRTKDQNVSYLASWLNTNLGIKIHEVRIIPDEEKKIIKNVLNLSKNYNYVFTTGGIGPTHDDITALSISKAVAPLVLRNIEFVSCLYCRAPMYLPSPLVESPK